MQGLHHCRDQAWLCSGKESWEHEAVEKVLLTWRAATRHWGTGERMHKPRGDIKIYPVLAVLWIVYIFAQCEGRRKEIHSYCPDSLLLTVHYCKHYSWVSHSEEIGNLTLLTHFHFTNHFHHDIFIYFFLQLHFCNSLSQLLSGWRLLMNYLLFSTYSVLICHQI